MLFLITGIPKMHNISGTKAITPINLTSSLILEAATIDNINPLIIAVRELDFDKAFSISLSCSSSKQMRRSAPIAKRRYSFT